MRGAEASARSRVIEKWCRPGTIIRSLAAPAACSRNRKVGLIVSLSPNLGALTIRASYERALSLAKDIDIFHRVNAKFRGNGSADHPTVCIRRGQAADHCVKVCLPVNVRERSPKLGLRRLEEFDRVARGIIEHDLLAARSTNDVVAEDKASCF